MIRVRFTLLLGVIGAFALTTSMTTSASAFQLLSHRAIYELSLLPGRGGDVNAVAGRMVMEWSDDCEGYTTNQRMLMRVLRNDGVGINSDFQLSSWEDKAGDSFRFDVRTTVGRGKPDVFKGRATREDAGGGKIGGSVVFQQPADLKLALPKRIVFPSEHIARLIDAALAGKKRLTLPVFDGTGKDGLFEAVAFVLGPGAAAAADMPARARFKDVPSWRVRLSFFDFSSSDALPSYEVSLRLFANGVADQLILDYTDFAVVGKLSNIEVLEGGGC